MASKDRIEAKIGKVQRLESELAVLRQRHRARSKAIREELDQRAARASLKLNKQSEIARVQRRNTLLRAGLLIDNMGLAAMDRGVLRGALLSALAYDARHQVREKWRTAGVRVLAALGSSTGKQSKAQRHHWITTGAVIDRSELMDWETAALAQVLILIDQGRCDVARRRQWLMRLEPKVELDDSVPVTVSFPGEIAGDLALALQDCGLVFDPQGQVWRGTASPSEIRKLTDRAEILEK